MLTLNPAALAGRRVAVVGDIILDHYVFGRVDRISPEAPIPVLRAMQETETLGGAGNVVRNLVAVRAQPTLVGVVGSDRQADRVAELMAEEGIASNFLVTAPDRPTTVKTRFLAAGHPILRTDWEDDAPLSDPLADRLLRHATAVLDAAEAVVLSDYGKGALSRDLAPCILKAARERRLPVIVDPKAIDWTRYAGATAITPNRAELRAAAALHRDASAAAMIEAAEALRQRHRLGAVVLTRSEEGITLVTGERPPLDIPARAREITDVSGAGDTVVAILAAGLAARLPLPEVASLANIAAGIVVGKLGAATAATAEIERELGLLPEQTRAAEGRMLGTAALRVQVETWRQAGLRIGVVPGRFAAIRDSHVRLLACARRNCDRLVVLAQGAEGTEVLAALGMVDAVTSYPAEAAETLLRHLAPDLLVTVPERMSTGADAIA